VSGVWRVPGGRRGVGPPGDLRGPPSSPASPGACACCGVRRGVRVALGARHARGPPVGSRGSRVRARGDLPPPAPHDAGRPPGAGPGRAALVARPRSPGAYRVARPPSPPRGVDVGGGPVATRAVTVSRRQAPGVGGGAARRGRRRVGGGTPWPWWPVGPCHPSPGGRGRPWRGGSAA